jgi:hypothetical protein
MSTPLRARLRDLFDFLSDLGEVAFFVVLACGVRELHGREPVARREADSPRHARMLHSHSTFLAPHLARPHWARAAAASARQPERHVLSGDDVAVYNLCGKMRVEPGSGSDVVVDVERGGGDGARLRVEEGEVSGRPTLRVIYPADRIFYNQQGSGRSRTELRVRDDGTFNGDSDGWRGGHHVVISSDGGGLDAFADLTVRLPAGKRLALHLAAGDVTLTNVSGDIIVDVHAASVHAERVRGHLVFDTGSGDVRIADAEGDVDLDTGSGATTLAGVRGERLRVDAGSGLVTGSAIEVRELSLDLGSGGTRLTGVRAPDIRLDTGSGDTDLALESDVRSLDIDAGSGGVTLRVPETLGASLEVDAGSGGIDVQLPVQVTKWTGDYLLGKLGDGEGHIRIDSGSGRVRLLRAMPKS